jgi:hypothetical protein
VNYTIPHNLRPRIMNKEKHPGNKGYMHNFYPSMENANCLICKESYNKHHERLNAFQDGHYLTGLIPHNGI